MLSRPRAIPPHRDDGPTFPISIAEILGLRADLEVIDPDACRPVASVHDDEPGRDRSALELPREPMSPPSAAPD